MKITSALFAKSYYAIGPGLDIQPLIRLTHLTDTFIYANLFLEKEEVVRWYEEMFSFYGFEITEKKIINDFDERNYFELNRNYRFHLTNPDFISVNELRDYQNIFQNALEIPQYALIYTLFKKETGRTITWYFFTGEGVASYIALSQNGKYAPQVLSTIETGVLEHPESLLNNFFRNYLHKKPLLWIRGFEPRYSFPGTRNDTLDETGVFSARAMDFSQTYRCGWSYEPRQQTTKRYCKGFVTPETFKIMKSLKIKDIYLGENHKFSLKGIDQNTKNIKPGDFILIIKGFKLDFYIEDVTIVYLEDLTSDFPYWLNWNKKYPSKTFNYLFLKLSNLLNSTNSTIHIVPFFMEDVGKIYFMALQKFTFKTIIYIKNPFDLIDLKEPSDDKNYSISDNWSKYFLQKKTNK